MGILDYVNPNVLFLAGLVLLTFVMLRRTYHRLALHRRRENKAMKRLSDRGTDPPSTVADMPVEHLRWQVELHESTRDMKAELDTKMRALQQLIAVASRERENLEQAIDRAKQLDATAEYD